MTQKYIIHDLFRPYYVKNKGSSLMKFVHIGHMNEYMEYFIGHFFNIQGVLIEYDKSKLKKLYDRFPKYRIYDSHIELVKKVDQGNYSSEQEDPNPIKEKFDMISVCRGANSYAMLSKMILHDTFMVVCEYDLFDVNSMQMIIDYCYGYNLQLMHEGNEYLVFCRIF